jgi:DNA-binding NarL/FixJ family response regulator
MTRRRALIVARRSPLREGLSRLINSISGIEIAGETGDISRALKMIDERQPDLVLIDADLPGGAAWEALQRAKRAWPETRYVMLADHCHQGQAVRENYADAVLQKGMPAATLVQAIEALLPKEEQGEPDRGTS